MYLYGCYFVPVSKVASWCVMSIHGVWLSCYLNYSVKNIHHTYDIHVEMPLK